MEDDEDVSEEPKMAERRHLTIRELAMLGALLMNFGAFVWNAAIISKTVDELKVAVSSLNTTVSNVSVQISNIRIEYEARIRVLESYIGEHNK